MEDTRALLSVLIGILRISNSSLDLYDDRSRVLNIYKIIILEFARTNSKIERSYIQKYRGLAMVGSFLTFLTSSESFYLLY